MIATVIATCLSAGQNWPESIVISSSYCRHLHACLRAQLVFFLSKLGFSSVGREVMADN